MSQQTYKYLDPEALGKLKNMSVAARRVVEGFFAGHHRSPFKGFSIEFAEHREYTPGVDPRHLDWRVYGRRDKLYVKQYEEETSLRCYLLIDKSASMGYRSDAAQLTKLEYASFLAASLAYVMAFQHDAVGLITSDTGVQSRIPARQGSSHLQVLLQHLEKTTPSGQTNLAANLHELAESLKRRALIVLISDLFDEPDKVVEALKHFRHKRSEVIVIQTLDPAEIDFPFDDITRIEDLETAREVVSDPQAFRKAYLEELAKFLEVVRGGCRSAGIDYTIARTDEAFDRFLGNYLTRRQAMNR
jgi:uncharacterized protein (DUF58 family)